MKPDAYMPFYGNDFFSATDGYPDSVCLGYLRACWHYWHHTHCAGLPDEPEYLRRVCRIEAIEWARTKDVIFGAFFRLSNGKWHQERAAKEYEKTVKAYQNKVAGAAKARNRSSDINPDTNPDITLLITDNQNQNQNQNHRQSQNQNKKTVGAKESPPTAESIISELSAMECYKGIDVAREFGKMSAWCAANNKQPTRKRFVNWLNRAEKPLASRPQRQGWVP